MMSNSLKTLEKIATNSKKSKLAFNPSSYLIKENPSSVKKILKLTDVLIFNKEEAELLCGYKNMKELLKICHTFGPKIVVITDGRNECYVSDTHFLYSTKPRKVKIKETTGAGDAFASSFITGLIIRNDIEFAIRLGLTNSESVIQHIGAKEKLLSYSSALRSMKNPKHKVKIEKFK